KKSAEDIIAEAVTDWESTLRALEAVDTVKEFRAKAEQLRDLELQRAQQLLAKGETPEKVLEMLARGITNKLLHSPTTQLKAAVAEGRREFIESARELYQLNERDS
ncbi:MAG: glutamyl-tRNA reductase, partial [Spongiibacteraceae bacterium]